MRLWTFVFLEDGGGGKNKAEDGVYTCAAGHAALVASPMRSHRLLVMSKSLVALGSNSNGFMAPPLGGNTVPETVAASKSHLMLEIVAYKLTACLRTPTNGSGTETTETAATLRPSPHALDTGNVGFRAFFGGGGVFSELGHTPTQGQQRVLQRLLLFPESFEGMRDVLLMRPQTRHTTSNKRNNQRHGHDAGEKKDRERERQQGENEPVL